jgi:hypothetical protein
MYEQAINRLCHARKSEVAALQTTHAAFMLWALPNDDRLNELRHALISSVREHITPEWLQRAPAAAVFTAATALAVQKPRAITAQEITLLVQRLVQSEQTIGGPYAFGGKSTFGINAVISCLLATIARPTPQLTAFLHASKHGDDSDFTTPALAFLRATTGINQPAYTPPKPWQGSWNAEALAYGEPPSAIATTAVMAALHRQYATTEARDLAISYVNDYFAQYTPPLSRIAVDLLASVLKADTTDEIALTSHFFAESLKTPPALAKNDIAKLNAATICGWIAYTVYDTFLDDTGKQLHLPVANMAMRQSVRWFEDVAAATKCPPPIHESFAAMDCANAWEIAHARFVLENNVLNMSAAPNYTGSLHLANRSIAHTLGPRILLAACNATSSQMIAVTNGLKHFLAARQLCDDLYDWQDDLQQGQVSFVVAALLKKAGTPQGRYSYEGLLHELQPIFATAILPVVNASIQNHIATARALFASTGMFLPHGNVDARMTQLLAAAQQTPVSHYAITT